MLRISTVILLVMISHQAQSDTLSYYKATESLKGFKLKSALSKILQKNHIDRGYYSLIDIYFESDLDNSFENDGSILDIYSEIPNLKDPYVYSNRSQKCGNYNRESDCFNREHIFPQSIFNDEFPMKSDFHHVYPVDGLVNSKRHHYPFGEVIKPIWTSKNGSKLGVNSYGNFRGKVFEPIDEFKGDVSRALLYFATRYEGQVSKWNHEMLNGSSDQVYADWFISMLLKWHKEDPVSSHDINRNNVGFKYQGNRNPFIDHPEWVELIWGK